MKQYEKEKEIKEKEVKSFTSPIAYCNKLYKGKSEALAPLRSKS